MFWYAGVLEPVVIAHLCEMSHPGFHASLRGLPEVFARLEAALAKGPWLMGDRFTTVLHYDADEDFPDVEIDTAIYSSREPFLHFQATNKAYGRKIDLRKGSHSLEISIDQVRINDASARFAIAVWANQRSELLFWWRIPAVFQGVDHSTGNSFLKMDFRDLCAP
jgi:hypothetical protein